MKEEKLLYRVVFTEKDKVRTLYAHYVSEETMMGFIEVDQLVFSAEDGQESVSASEKAEFQGVERIYLPLHVVLRIDEVLKPGLGTQSVVPAGNNVHHLTDNTRAKD
jgi:hypothetical protein